MTQNIKFGCVGDIMLGAETSVGFGIRTLSEKNGFDYIPFVPSVIIGTGRWDSRLLLK